MNEYIGKTLKDEKDEDYIVLKLLDYKGIICAYAMKVTDNEDDGEKRIFQFSKDNGGSLISIESKKMINDITNMLIETKDIIDKPRKIKDGESIADYLKYLDEFYKTRIVTRM